MCGWLFLFLLAAGLVTQAAAQSPAGRWRTIDDKTGQVKSIVNLWVQDGVLYGRVEKIINPDPNNPEHKCMHCPGDLDNKPVVGLQFLWGLKQAGNEWNGGYILDPDNGTTYKCLIALEDKGKKMKVRGFIGFSLLGRSQTWTREP